MEITTPSAIPLVAWEGALEAPPVAMAPKGAAPVVVTIGRPEVWAAAEALQNEVHRPWTPPLGLEGAWLVRFACTLRAPGPPGRITEARQNVYLTPRHAAAPAGSAYAFSLFPERLTVEDSQPEFHFNLGPELTFASGAGFKVGELGVKIQYRRVFPAIQSYGAGEPAPYWVFKPRALHPLEGTQFVYAVVAARVGAGGARGALEVIVTVEDRFGVFRLGLPEEARAHVGFTVP